MPDFDAIGPAACSWDKINGLLPPTPCPEPAICTTIEACEHEHVHEARACAAHAEGRPGGRAGPVLRVHDRAGPARLPDHHRVHLGRPHGPGRGDAGGSQCRLTSRKSAATSTIPRPQTSGSFVMSKATTCGNAIEPSAEAC